MNLTNEQKMIVCEKVKHYCDLAKIKYPYEVTFNEWRGRVAGTANVYGRIIDFNARLCAENFEHFIVHTVAHEVAHIVQYDRHGPVKSKGGKNIWHGKIWKDIMQNEFNVEPNRCHSYFVETKAMKTFEYKCACRNWVFTIIRHNKMIRGTTYTCPKCKGVIK